MKVLMIVLAVGVLLLVSCNTKKNNASQHSPSTNNQSDAEMNETDFRVEDSTAMGRVRGEIAGEHADGFDKNDSRGYYIVSFLDSFNIADLEKIEGVQMQGKPLSFDDVYFYLGLYVENGQAIREIRKLDGVLALEKDAMRKTFSQ